MVEGNADVKVCRRTCQAQAVNSTLAEQRKRPTMAQKAHIQINLAAVLGGPAPALRLCAWVTSDATHTLDVCRCCYTAGERHYCLLHGYTCSHHWLWHAIHIPGRVLIPPCTAEPCWLYSSWAAVQKCMPWKVLHYSGQYAAGSGWYGGLAAATTRQGRHRSA